MKLKHLLILLLPALLACGSFSPNTRFQKVWYDVERPRVALVRSPARTLSDYTAEFRAQLELAELYGGPRVVLIGDSNAEYAARREIMTEFETVAVNLGVGGSATDDWVKYFNTEPGGSIRERLQKPGVVTVLSIGGNDILQGRNRNTAANYARLRTWFPDSIIILIPPVYTDFVALTTGRPAPKIKNEIDGVNLMAAQLWGVRLIDTATALRLPGSEAPVPGVLRDAVHYSPAAYDLIVRTVNAMVRAGR
jgi:GDSL-like Lipase/Acylhydrolase family